MAQNPGRTGGYVDQDASGVQPSAPDPRVPQQAPGQRPQRQARGLVGYTQQGQPAEPGPNARPPGPDVREVDPNRSAAMQDFQGVMRASDIEAARQGIVDGLTGTAPASRAISSVTDYFTKSREEGAEAAETRAKRTEAMEWYRGGQAKELFHAQPDLLGPAQQDPVGFYDKLKSGAAGSGEGTAAEPTGNEAPVPADAPPSVEAAAAATEEAAPKENPKKKGRGITKASPAQEKKATKTFMQYYAENAVPKIVEGYLQQGDIEKAQAFTDWASSVETKSQLENWSKAVFSASIGDEEGLLDHLGDTYNAFDDGFELVRGKSGFNHAPDGSIAGASMTFKNTETGEEFSREYENQGDLIEQGIYALAPENVFELLWQQNQAALKLQQQGGKGIEKRADAISAEVARLRKIDAEANYGKPDERLSEDELARMARENIQRYESLAAGRGAQAVTPPTEAWTNEKP